MNDVETMIVYGYDGAAILGIMFLIHVIRQAMDDFHLRRTDPLWVVRLRQTAFGTGMVYLVLTMYFQDYWLVNPTTIAVGIVNIGLLAVSIFILSASVVSLNLRAPPDKSPSQVHSSSLRQFVAMFMRR